MTDEYLITYSGCKEDGYIPVVTAPEIGEPLFYLAHKDGNHIRHDDPYKAVAHAGHYLCLVLNDRLHDHDETLTALEELFAAFDSGTECTEILDMLKPGSKARIAAAKARGTV